MPWIFVHYFKFSLLHKQTKTTNISGMPLGQTTKQTEESNLTGKETIWGEGKPLIN
jgi:hypothetical protein